MNRLAVSFCLLASFALVTACGSPEEDTSPPAPEPLSQGQFANKGGQETSGTYRLERVGEYRRLVLEDDFQTNDGPDLHIVLSPTPPADAGNENVMDEAAVLDSLSALQGKQVFYLADSLQIDDYQSVLIHCVEFSHLYGAAPIEQSLR